MAYVVDFSPLARLELLQAGDWYSKDDIKKASVVGAVLTLDYCLDFTDSRYIGMINSYYSLMESYYNQIGKDPATRRRRKPARSDAT